MSLPVNIEDLIHGKTIEWERIEFKEGFQPEPIIHTICAFANDINNWGGGYIVLGIKEDGGKAIFPPIGLAPDQIDLFQKKIFQLCHTLDPYYHPILQPYEKEDKLILVIWVPGGDNRPYKSPKKLSDSRIKNYYIRRGSSTVLANHQEELKLIEMSTKTPFDDRISHFGSLEDIDIRIIEQYLFEVGSDLYKEVKNLTLQEICKKLEIARGPNENLRPLNIGLLMFSKSPEKLFKGAIIDIVFYNDYSGTQFTEKSFTGPIHIQVREALSYIKTNVIKEQITKVQNQEEVFRIVNYPFNAIEEALVNAVYHKSYELDNHVEVNVFPDKIEIINYPGPLPPLDQEAMLQERVIARDYRNRRIGDYLKELKLTEGRGTGIPTIRLEMNESGCPPPEFVVGKENSHLLVILKINSDWRINKSDNENIKLENLTNIEQLILENCKSAKSHKELLKLLNNIDKSIIKESLKRLIKLKYLLPKEFKLFFGMYRVLIFTTTERGRNALKSSF